MLAGQLNQIVVLDASRGGQDHARSPVVRFDVLGQIVASQGPELRQHVFINIKKGKRSWANPILLDVLGWAQDGAAQRSALESSGVEVVKHNLL